MKDKPDRRNFLSKAIKTIMTVGIGVPVLDANAKQGGEKIKFLTPDGKLVEIDKNILDKKAPKQKASNKEILNWASKK
jgi:hypothetical protein